MPARTQITTVDLKRVAELELLEGIAPPDLTRLFAGCETVDVTEGSNFVLGGDEIHCGLVAQGRLALEYESAADRPRIVTLVEESDILIRRRPTVSPRFSVRALVDSQLVLIDNDRFATWLRHPGMAAALIGQMSRQVGDRELATATALEPRVEDRLMMRLGQLAEKFGRVTPQGLRLDLRLTHQQLADMVGAVRESVTIAMGKLAASGDLIVDNRTIWIPHASDGREDS